MVNVFPRFIFFIFILSLVLIFSSGLAARQNHGVLIGTVVDEAGVGLPGVNITIFGPLLSKPIQAITDRTGNFRITDLYAGQYSAKFVLKGFKKAKKKEIIITKGKETGIQVIMPFAKVSDFIHLDHRPVIDHTSWSL